MEAMKYNLFEVTVTRVALFVLFLWGRVKKFIFVTDELNPLQLKWIDSFWLKIYMVSHKSQTFSYKSWW